MTSKSQKSTINKREKRKEQINKLTKSNQSERHLKRDPSMFQFAAGKWVLLYKWNQSGQSWWKPVTHSFSKETITQENDPNLTGKLYWKLYWNICSKLKRTSLGAAQLSRFICTSAVSKRPDIWKIDRSIFAATVVAKALNRWEKYQQTDWQSSCLENCSELWSKLITYSSN